MYKNVHINRCFTSLVLILLEAAVWLTLSLRGAMTVACQIGLDLNKLISSSHGLKRNNYFVASILTFCVDVTLLRTTVPLAIFEGQQQVAAKTLSFVRNKKQIFSSVCIISAFILISLSSSSPSCVALMGLNPAGSLPVFFGARRRCRFWHLRSCGLLKRRLNSELHENG